MLTTHLGSEIPQIQSHLPDLVVENVHVCSIQHKMVMAHEFLYQEHPNTSVLVVDMLYICITCLGGPHMILSTVACTGTKQYQAPICWYIQPENQSVV